MTKKIIEIHTDGGSRGNPGPAACAFVIENGNTILVEGSKFLGHKTNNIAEYSGVLLALNNLTDFVSKEENTTDIHFYLDSELVVKQLNGLYKIKDDKLKILAQEVNERLSRLKNKTMFMHVPREKNKRADMLVNKELDRITTN